MIDDWTMMDATHSTHFWIKKRLPLMVSLNGVGLKTNFVLVSILEFYFPVKIKGLLSFVKEDSIKSFATLALSWQNKSLSVVPKNNDVNRMIWNFIRKYVRLSNHRIIQSCSFSSMEDIELEPAV